MFVQSDTGTKNSLLSGYANTYKFGFNGKEKVDEISNVTGSDLDYGARIYDSRICRFLSIDPISKKYPWYTPYQYAGNTPIQAIDLDGKEPDYIVSKRGRITEPVISLINALLGYDAQMMRNVYVYKNYCLGKNETQAQTPSATRIQTNPNWYTYDNDWIAVVGGHEMTHVKQFLDSPYPELVNNIAYFIDIKVNSYDRNPWESKACVEANIVYDFSVKYDPSSVLKSGMSIDKQCLTLEKMAYSYKKDKLNQGKAYFEKQVEQAQKNGVKISADYIERVKANFDSAIATWDKKIDEVSKKLETTK